LRKLLAIQDRLLAPASPAGRLFGVVLCLVMVGVALIPSHLVQVWLTRDLALRFVSLLLFALAVLNQWGKESEEGIRLDAFDLLALAGMGWFALSAWNSERSFEAFYSLRGFWALALLWFALRAGWRRWPELYPWFIAVFLGTALVGSVWVALETVHNHWIPIEGPFTNINFAAAFIGMAFLAVLVRLWRGGTASDFVLLSLFFIGWVAARSRGSLLAIIIAVAVFVLFHAKEFEEKLSRWSRRQWWISGAVILVMLALTAPMVNRLLHAGEHDPRAYWRVLIWKSSLEMAADHPLLGVGPGIYGTFYPYYRPAKVWFNENPFAHNEYLQAASEAGWPGLIWALLVVGSLIAALLVLSRRWERSPGNVLEGRAVDAALLVVLMAAVHSSLDFVFHEWCVALTVLALASYALRNPVNLGLSVTFRFSKPVKWIWLVCVGFGLIWVMGVGSLRDERAQRLHMQALHSGMEGNAESAEALEQRALEFSPRYSTAWNTLAYLSDYLAHKTDSIAKRTALTQRASDMYREALKCAPHDMLIRENQIEFYMGNNAWRRALELQKDLTFEAPRHLPNYDRQAKIYLAMHRPQEAVATCELAIQMKSTYMPAAFVQTQAFLAMGDRVKALAVARRALETEPDETEPPEMEAAREQLSLVVQGLQRSSKVK
jgi:O-antigen ligase